ncbi:MAG TPA: glycosyltransferase family 4 protein [Pyrinomonadaceae bacterium]|nr:glycosyltransferase family 4 protein [Pyrinomonadaceae bacterium]
MTGRRILITNLKLEGWTGTELFVRDIARGLLEAGHRPVIYSPRLGRLAAEIRKETIPVIEDLSQLSRSPDIIHGQHVNETLTALLHFPNAPALYFCHDWYFDEDHPPRFPRILRYAAVDDACYDKLVWECGVPEDRAHIVPQFADLARFVPRPPLPSRPSRAVVLCNHTKENEYLQAAREACARRGLKLDVYGAGVGQTCERPEEVLRGYDVVFAKGRAALEAAAVGAAVIVYWWRRLGPMVKTRDLEQLRADGFGMRWMSAQLTPEEFGHSIERALEDYDPIDAAEVSQRVRLAAGRDTAVKELLRLYEEVIAEHHASPSDREVEGQAAAAHLRDISVGYRRQREAIFSSTPFRVTEQLLRMPVIGKVARTVARGLAGKRNGNTNKKNAR